MTNPRARDETTDRLLRRALAGPPGPRTDECLDADTLAAWMDDALSGAALERAEQHAAGCAHCQAVLAAVARTAPEPAAAPRGRSWVGWVVPLAAAAGIIIAVVIIPGADRAPSTDQAARAADTKLSEQPSTPAEPNPTLPPPARSTARTMDEVSAVPAAQSANAALLKGGVTPLIDVPTPNNLVRWRISGASVERTIDDGLTWTSVPTGVESPLAGGSAPSETTCWLVGRAGLVLLTTDGRTWQTLRFPEPVDLVSITASDGSTAAVTSSDGRVFRTSDAGRTWRPDRD